MPSTAARMISLLFLITPIFGHRFITGDEQNNAFDSIVVSSDPIKITNNKYNEARNSTTTRKPDYAIRFNRNTLTNDNDLEATNSEERSFKDCKHNDIKCLYDSSVADKTESSTNKNQDIINKFLEQYSSITNVKFNLEELENTTKEDDENDDKNASDLKKSYWSLVNAEKHNHPYDDKKGWVTLEPVPWSSSKVSKWQSSAQPSHPPSSSNNNNNYHHHPPPQHHYPSQSYYPSQSPYPTHPSQHLDERPWNYGPTQTPTAHVWVTNRPSQESESYSHYVKPTNPFSNYNRPSSQWGIGSNDIITDNRPNEFPDGSNNVYGTYQKPHYHFENQYAGPPKYNELQNFNNGYPGARPTRYPMPTGHPSTYPDRGNGEWILLSTTKGYSLPQRYRDTPKIVSIDSKSNDLAHDPMITSRNMKYPDISRYHEENIDDKYVLVSKNADVNRKSGEEVENNMESMKLISNDQNKTETPWNMDGLRILQSESGGSILAAAKTNARNGKDDWKMEENPINVLQTKTKVDGEPVMTYKRTVRLTVLPPLTNTSTTAHDGLLEVDSSYQQTVDESQQQEEERLKKLSELANIKKANFGKYKLVPVQGISGKSINSKSAAVLAAVGAGMIPATMAVLVPMALGRKKRDLDSLRSKNKISSYDFPRQYRSRNSARW